MSRKTEKAKRTGRQREKNVWRREEPWGVGKRQRKYIKGEETGGEKKRRRGSSGKCAKRLIDVQQGSPEEYPAGREALEKPVGANLFYFEYKVGDEIFPAAVKMCVVDVRTDLARRAAGKKFFNKFALRQLYFLCQLV